jgi:hypothetical protein
MIGPEGLLCRPAGCRASRSSRALLVARDVLASVMIRALAGNLAIRKFRARAAKPARHSCGSRFAMRSPTRPDCGVRHAEGPLRQASRGRMRTICSL